MGVPNTQPRGRSGRLYKGEEGKRLEFHLASSFSFFLQPVNNYTRILSTIYPLNAKQNDSPPLSVSDRTKDPFRSPRSPSSEPPFRSATLRATR